jgi:hypothetical protein
MDRDAPVRWNDLIGRERMGHQNRPDAVGAVDPDAPVAHHRLDRDLGVLGRVRFYLNGRAKRLGIHKKPDVIGLHTSEFTRMMP